jgi:hypothetical protein
MTTNRQNLRVSVLADMNWESKIDHALKVLELTKSFDERNHDYGASLAKLCVIFMCRDPDLAFKQRIRYQKADRIFSRDIMLSLPEVVVMSHPQRRRLLADCLLEQVPECLRRYRFAEFDYRKFEDHWRHDITSQLLGPDSGRFDHLYLAQASGVTQ